MKISKYIILPILISNHLSVSAWSMNDIERGGLFLMNTASLGTLLPTMEAEIEQIKLEYAIKLVQFEKDLNISANARSVALIEAEKNEIEPIFAIHKKRKIDLEKQLAEIQQLANQIKEFFMNDNRSKQDLSNLTNEIRENMNLLISLSDDISERHPLVSKKCAEQGSPIDCRTANLMHLMQVNLGKFEKLETITASTKIQELSDTLVSSTFFLKTLLAEVETSLSMLRLQMDTLDKLKNDYSNLK